MMERCDHDEVSLRLHQALTGAGFTNPPANPPDEMEIEYDPLLNTLEELTLASPEEMQACEDSIMADMDQWVPIDEAQVGNEDKDLEDADDILAEQYEQLRVKYLDANSQPTDYTPCACIECIKLYEWEDPAGPTGSSAPILYKPTPSTFQPSTSATHETQTNLPNEAPPTRPLPLSRQTNPPTPTKRRPINPFFPSSIYKTSLLHTPTPSANTPLFHTQEYILSLRLLKLRRRWSHLALSDFTTELGTLRRSLSNPGLALAPWPPLAAWLAQYYAAMQGVPRNRRFRVKMGLLKGLEEVARARARESKSLVDEAVRATGESLPSGVWGLLRRGVDDECEARGCLGLARLPEFTDRVVGGMSGGWSWVD
ncbi:hypothetical protein COCC4DRAFT_64227 [Bipolaris maydis ATCC 48331]|uniref:Uncharacterized protein n=2 Tax=Cochliobolus heterostrophus TaxID=5016 RepID=M2U8K1_COCH5|nr:uncharacterized protein COCC4DRAFT_64227 [Bipolaris maydis ATCC 48331]EMD94864.1 hypothetical protein COCHEDRAFT_1222144 [Bipolaris maydis C5]KAH7555951.1 hypothetical protein BM1_06477 [Bipolaris maydis]ENI01844.1 hypothetical protein COCC4DRAFT_64227 [Bipolaris maydis ATCC 48331]KAJ5029266.1 hypothetical protein J3E73DRAFT_421199 [Bipolaris maydis]KAJ5061997.1 hypothetical protein J3E74DRAFT_417364 [Bipolaris maydis]